MELSFHAESAIRLVEASRGGYDTAMRFSLGWIFCLALLCFAGCATGKTSRKAATGPAPASENGEYTVTSLSAGYALLVDLLGNEGNVDKVLLIKGESSPVHELIKEISRFSKESGKALEQRLTTNSTMNLKDMGLPRLETETREAIAHTRMKQLVFAGGRKFELALLLTQTEALSYGGHLAKRLHEAETDVARRTLLSDISKQYGRLYDKAFALLLSRMDGAGRD